jgi:hypothetical protein
MTLYHDAVLVWRSHQICDLCWIYAPGQCSYCGQLSLEFELVSFFLEFSIMWGGSPQNVNDQLTNQPAEACKTLCVRKFFQTE